MSGGFGTDADLMNKAGNDIDQIRGEIEHTVRTLSGQIEPVLAVWKGGASDVFRKLMTQFEDNASTINRKLGEISENIGASSKDYSQREEEQAQEMSKIEGLLNG